MFDLWRRKNSNLIEYFYYFLLVSLGIIFILGGSLYFYFSAVLRQEVTVSNNNTLEQLKNSQELILGEIDKAFASVVLDSSFDKFMDYYNRDDIINIMDVQSKASNIPVSNEYIDSVYAVYMDAGIVVSSDQGIMKIEEFYDREFVRQLRMDTVKGDEMFTRIKTDFMNNQEIAAVSFLKPIPLQSYGKPKAVVIVNMKGIYLQKMLDTIQTNQLSNIMIFDQEGRIVSQKNTETTALNQRIIDNIAVNMERRSGYYEKDILGTRMLVSYMFSDKYKWMYVYATPVSSVTQSIYFLGAMTLLLCVLMIVLSVLGSFFLSKRIYSPIHALIGLFDRNLNKEKETVFIQKQIHRLIDSNRSLAMKNKDLEMLLYDFEIYQKSNFLKQLVDGTRTGDKKLVEKLEYYSIHLHEHGYFVAFVIVIDHYDDYLNHFSEKQQNMQFVYISECASAQIFNTHGGFVVETNANEIVVMINFDPALGETAVRSIAYGLATQFHQAINDNMQFTFTMGVSMLFLSLDGINQSYLSGVMAVNQRMLLGHKSVIFYENINFEGASNKSYPHSIERSLLSSLKTGDLKHAMACMDEFNTYMVRSQSDDIEFVRHYFLLMVSAIYKCLYEIDKNSAAIAKEKTTYSTILKLETIQNMDQHLRQICTELILNQEQQRSEKNNEIVQAVAGYITQHLTEDLSMEVLAEKFYISSSHLRKIFKNETGTTIKECVDEARLQKAKELLEYTSIKIYDIPEKVGYQTVQAFTRAFKLNTGKTPGDYRLECGLKSQDLNEE
jgi:AraC-like DNA-binding protein